MMRKVSQWGGNPTCSVPSYRGEEGSQAGGGPREDLGSWGRSGGGGEQLVESIGS